MISPTIKSVETIDRKNNPLAPELECARRFGMLIEAVHRMRGLQKEYFRTRSSLVLKEAKHAEKRVDDFLNEEDAKGNPSLFDAMKGGAS